MSLEGKKLRIKDIAALAGVSPGTVDRVIHNRGQVTEENREKILNIIEELDYKPNLIARSLANKKKYLFVSLCPEFSSTNDYWKAPDHGIQKAASEISNYNISVKQFFFDQFSVKSFNVTTSEILQLKPDGVVLSPVFRKETLDFVRELDTLKIPYVFIDSNIEGLNNISYLGQNSFQSGYLAAKILHKTMPVASSVLIVRIGGTEILNQSQHREEGIQQFLRDSGKPQQFKHIDLDLNKSESIGQLNRQLNQDLPQGIIVINSRSFEVASILKASNKSFNLIGYDLLPENIRCLKEGSITFLIAQCPEYQGYKGVLTLFDYVVLKQKVDKNNYLPIDILTSDNIDYYLNFI
jgi:LacI family transcriptional regulator